MATSSRSLNLPDRIVRSRRAISVLLCLGAVGTLHAQLPGRMGRIAERLPAQDVQKIAALVSSPKDVVWLLEGMASQVLPEKWHVDAYLLPDSNGGQVRRGRVLQLSSLIVGGSPSKWQTDGTARYAQVGITGRQFVPSPTVSRLDRPFLLDGKFTDAELSSIVSFIRSSPRQTKRLPDGTVYSVGFDVAGAWPIVAIDRTPAGDPKITLRSSPSSGQTVVVRGSAQRWRVVEVTVWVA